MAAALYGVMYVLAKGPSPTARNLFVMSVRETSAMGFLANLFFTEDEIAQIMGNQTEEIAETDTSLITIQREKPENSDRIPDAWGLVDEDGDGIILEPVKGETYSGYMMVVLDPSRVIMGSVPKSFNARGYTVAQMAEQFDAVAGINAGGFDDPDGNGNGSVPWWFLRDKSIFQTGESVLALWDWMRTACCTPESLQRRRSRNGTSGMACVLVRP